MASTYLPSVLVLLAASVLAVSLCRRFRLPGLLGYLFAGVALGPHAFALVSDREEIRHLAEFGIVFLMFSIGLEFSLAKLVALRRIVLGFGGAQVGATIAISALAATLFGASWQEGVALGGILAMSSTAIVSKLLAERLELDSPHGRQALGVLLFQDLAVVPLLVLVPALGQPVAYLGLEIGVALAKAALALALILVAGPWVMRSWLGIVARRQSAELFVLNVLFVVLLLAFVTGLAGLSLALGAFLAGMLVSETEYRFQVEQDIRPFRDVLLGLFFVTIGMLLDLKLVSRELGAVAAFFAVLVLGKLALVAVLSRAFGTTAGAALRVGLALAQAGEFGFVLLSLASGGGLIQEASVQALLAAMILSMLAAPFLVSASDRLVMRLSRSEWTQRSLELHRVAVQALEAERHVLILGYGRNGQRLARLLDAEGVRYVALDLDPERVREAAAAGEPVVFADCARREALVAGGIARAAAVAVTFADTQAALRVLANIHELNPRVPVVARARDERDIERLASAGASEVVPEAFESGLMLASHTLALLGVPLSRILRRMSRVRGERYRLLQGLFEGESGPPDEEGVRLHTVTLLSGSHALSRPLASLGLEALGVRARTVRRPGVRAKLAPDEAGALQEGDAVVLLGSPEALAAAEDLLLRG